MAASRITTSDFKTVPIVIDVGSGSCRAGSARDTAPRIVFPTVVGRPIETAPTKSSVAEYVGNQVMKKRSKLTFRSPIEHGVISDWDDMEKIWRHAFDRIAMEPSEHPVILSEPPLNHRSNRRKMTEVMFEKFNVPALHIGNSGLMALYSSGQTSGIVLDCGDGVSYTMLSAFGYCEKPETTHRMDLAGGDLTDYLGTMLKAKGYKFETSAERESLRRIKEKVCYVARNFDDEMESAACNASLEKTYKMPDGRVIRVGSERFRCPEALFKPSLVGPTGQSLGVHEMLFNSVMKSDPGVRRLLFENIFIAGGSTLLPSFAERLERDIKSLETEHRMATGGAYAMNVRVRAPETRQHAVFAGSAILASLGTFGGWIGRPDYDECGPSSCERMTWH